MSDYQVLTTATTVTDDRTWLASLDGVHEAQTITVDTSKLISGTHYTAGTLNQPRHIIKSGIPLGKITASGLYAPYNSAASDGTQILAGFLVTETAFTPGSAKTAGALLWRGEVYAAKLPLAFAPPAAANTTTFIHYR
ncbi:head decoration protein [Streptomyces europaeiscabiei]|uniref:Head decoration protein n=1 Tax=Streptomyces europaeiscabiei TaxID=146819 RepID=A0AAJ2PNX3_9ACTN|nr:head decoration protein [Streptomyces europaeiscabiei]MDX3130810.1 head decoration protein [Streptomyces europaeiscabiei]